MRSLRIFIVHLIAFCVPQLTQAQPNGPWNAPLLIAWSTDGQQFATPTIFQDSSGVPSVVRWRGDTLVAAFQWFREPRTAPTWDRVAVKFSYDAGMTWTEPTPIVVEGLPLNYQRPFDPTLAVVDDQMRIYFSSSDGMTTGGLTEIVNSIQPSVLTAFITRLSPVRASIIPHVRSLTLP